MREIVVISGKGGTGKTTVVGSLACLAKSQVLADNDVDAADLHLLLEPTIREAHDFVGGTKCTIHAESCFGCGKCAAACHFKDCGHIHEPGCAVLEAVNTGLLDREVYESYLKLRREAEYFSASEHDKRKKGKSLSKLVEEVKKRNSKF